MYEGLIGRDTLNMEEQRISVVMTVYNQEAYVSEAIASILEQTYPWYEMIIIDDGSTDNSLAVLKQYAKKDGRIHIISRENKGLAESLNEGIKNATGNYIARMDADDYSYPTRFEKQMKMFSDRPELYLVGTNFNLLFEKGVTEETRKSKLRFEKNVNEPVSRIQWKEDIFEDYKILHPTWIFKKELFDYIGGYSNNCAEDVEFLFRTITHDYPVGKVDEILFTYRISETSKSAVESKTRKNKEEICNFKIDYLKSQLGSRMNSLSYYIWGADISGEIAKDIMTSRFKDSSCLGYIDGIKTGCFNGVPIFKLEEIKVEQGNYFLIATNGGRKNAISCLSALGKKVIEDYFKVI